MNKCIRKGSLQSSIYMLILAGSLCVNTACNKKNLESINEEQITNIEKELEISIPKIEDNINISSFVDIEEIEDKEEVKTLFKDDMLRNKIFENLNITSEEELTQEIIESVTELDLTSSNITSLEGIEIFTNLKKIRAYGNGISDLSPLEYLTSLEVLVFENNCIMDLTPLKNLKNITDLNISTNRVKDISIIENFENLTTLGYDTNPITNYIPIYLKIDKMAELFYESLNEPISEYGREWIRYQKEMLLKNEMVLADMKSWVNFNITDDMTDLEKEYKIINFISNRFSYNDDNKSYINLDEIYNKNYVVCYGYAIIFDYLATFAGLDTYTIKSWNDNKTSGHIWNAVKIDDNYYQLDLTYYDMYLELNDLEYDKYINVSNDTMIKLHNNIFIPTLSELTYETKYDMKDEEKARVR